MLKYKLRRLLMMLDFFWNKKAKDLCNKWIDSIHLLIRNVLHWEVFSSFKFFAAITNYITNLYKISKKTTASFSRSVVITFFDKMATANKIEEQTILSFTCNHLMVETVSTEEFTLMCHLHTPVYLFENSYQNSFIKWHFMVSSTAYF